MKLTKFIILASVLFLGETFAQNTYDFLRIDSSPRASALANAYVADNTDPNIIFYNPAGIATIENIPISFSFLKHLSDINSVSLSSTFAIKGLGKFASALQYVNYGNFVERDEAGNELGSFNPSDLAFTVAYANSFSENIYYGASIKLINSTIAEKSSFGIAGDVGIQYLLPEHGWNIGLSLLNMGSQITYFNDLSEDLPFSIQLGATKKLTHMPLQLFFALTRLNDEDRIKYFNLGAEFTLSKIIQLRFGYDNMKRVDYKIASTSALGGFSFGLGIDVSDYDVDYTFSSMGSIGALHRIGVTAVIK